ncbi:Pyruvate kinase 1 cytosolic [Bienertia sinuspersici]
MQGGQTVVEEPIRLSSVLTPSTSDDSRSLTKIMATLGPRSRTVNTIEACLKAGMSVARFDFSCFDIDYHQETIDNLRIASRNEKKLCAVMLDTVGPEILISNKEGKSIELKAEDLVTFTSDITIEPSAQVLPINYAGLAKEVKKGDTVFLGQYLFTGSETTSVWLEVSETNGEDIICQVKNSATLTGYYFNLHISRVQVNLPTLTDYDKQIISTWGSRNNIDFISLHYTRHADDVREVRAFLATQNLQDTQIYAKVETVEGLMHFDEILKESDGVILARGNLGIDLPPEKVFLFQKSAAYRCNMAGKPLIITRVVDSMAGNLRPTRAEATDVANAVLDGADGILLGGETFGGLYPVGAIKTVGKICAEAEYVYNQALNFKRIVKYAGEPMSHAESVASSAVRVAVKVHAAIIAVFTSSGAAVRLITKYRPSTPVLAIVTPFVRSNSIKWSLTGSMQARQLLGLRGVSSYLASTEAANIGVVSEESVLKLALHHGKNMGLLRPNDKVVVFQKIGDSSVVKVVEFDD